MKDVNPAGKADMRLLLIAMLISGGCWVLSGCRSCKTQEPVSAETQEPASAKTQEPASAPPPGARFADTPATPPSAPRTEASQAQVNSGSIG